MCSNAMKLSPPPAENLNSASDVLTNNDLFNLILCRVQCPSCLVSAAVTSKRWRCGALKQVFVPDFCKRHLPRQLGFYVSSPGIFTSEFFPQPGASSPGVSAVLNHANFGLGDMPSLNVWDCRNGCVLYEFGEESLKPLGFAVRYPLRYPDEDKPVVLPPQPSGLPRYPRAMLLPADHGDDASCYRVDMLKWGDMVAMLVHVLRSGSWVQKCIAIDRLPLSLEETLPVTVLADGKIYVAIQAGYILGLKLATSEFFFVDLPEGVDFGECPGNFVHSRGEDSASVLYLFHVDGEHRLNVWLQRMDHHGHVAGARSSAAEWELRDTIPLRETCGHLVERIFMAAEDEDGEAGAISVVGTGDNAEFVFLEFQPIGVVMYMHIKTRVVKEVYQRGPYDDFYMCVRPFMLIRPPVFPKLKDDDDKAAHYHESSSQ